MTVSSPAARSSAQAGEFPPPSARAELMILLVPEPRSRSVRSLARLWARRRRNRPATKRPLS